MLTLTKVKQFYAFIYSYIMVNICKIINSFKNNVCILYKYKSRYMLIWAIDKKTSLTPTPHWPLHLTTPHTNSYYFQTAVKPHWPLHLTDPYISLTPTHRHWRVCPTFRQLWTLTYPYTSLTPTPHWPLHLTDPYTSLTPTHRHWRVCPTFRPLWTQLRQH